MLHDARSRLRTVPTEQMRQLTTKPVDPPSISAGNSVSDMSATGKQTTVDLCHDFMEQRQYVPWTKPPFEKPQTSLRNP